MPRNKIQEKALPVGLFILLGMLLLIFGIIWLRNFNLRPAYTFYVAFHNPSRLVDGYPVYFRGVHVGRIQSVELAEDLTHTQVTIGIHDKAVRLPKGSDIYIREEGITGQRFLQVQPPKTITSAATIQPGEQVLGAETLDWFEVQEKIAAIFEENRIENLMASTEIAMNELGQASHEFALVGAEARAFLATAEGRTNTVFDEIILSAQGIQGASRDAQGLIATVQGQFDDYLPQISAALNQFSSNTQQMNSAFVSVDEAARDVQGMARSLDQQITDSQVFPQLSLALQEFQRSISVIGHTFANVDQQLTETQLIPALSHTVGGLNTTVGGVNSLVTGLDSQLKTGAAPGLHTPVTASDLQQVRQSVARVETARIQLDGQLSRVQLTDSAPVTIVSSVSQLRALEGRMAKTLVGVEGLLDPAASQAVQWPQLEPLSRLGQDIVTTVSITSPALIAYQQATPLASQVLPVADLLQTLETLSASGNTLTRTLTSLRTASAPVSLNHKKAVGLGSVFATVSQINETAARFECTAARLNYMLDQRFLGFKLFFGKPAGEQDCIELIQNNPLTPVP